MNIVGIGIDVHLLNDVHADRGLRTEEIGLAGLGSEAGRVVAVACRAGFVALAARRGDLREEDGQCVALVAWGPARQSGEKNKGKSTYKKNGTAVESNVESARSQADERELMAFLKSEEEDVRERGDEGGDGSDGGDAGEALSLGEVALPDGDDEARCEVDVCCRIDAEHGDGLRVV